MKNKILSIVGLFIVILAGVYFGFFYKHTPQTLAYRNSQYGFEIPLPDSWKGYQTEVAAWQGTDVATGQVTQFGPKIILRDPQWTTQNPREDMPVMVFTKAQWDLIEKQTLAVGAAPVPPSKLGENSKYIIALPARYNYDFKPGWEEVDQIIHQLTAFEPR